MAVVAPKQRVQAPATRPLNGGLFSQFAPIESDDHQWKNGVTWEDVAAADIGTIGQFDCTPGATPGLPKDLTKPGCKPVESMPPLTVYATVKCSLLEHTPEEAMALATARLARYEEYAVEDALWNGVKGSGPALSKVQTLKNSGGTAAIEGAWQAFEKYGHSIGVAPVFHIPRRAAALACARLYVETGPGGTYVTRFGTPVVAGDGYADTPTFASTGPIVIYRSPVFSSTTRDGGMNLGKNDLVAVAERTYVIAFDPDDAYQIPYSSDPGKITIEPRKF
nr:MAG TPA: hypothetical protein [Caudoviricetes sp.]